ncbi:MAG TPA: deoxyguanosinetriphosphate triphosphohydrolase [Burkholderiaceae bacterium]|nr:deoxyguanosinetriphosphate triphosphohydrolase [Burkholderiaceae bacterium]
MRALAPYAVDPARSRGRRIAEPASPPRNDHERDRDRVVHCTAFRRLVYKTQVFLNHEGDLYRTRLTHSLEVAQLGRSMARALALNEDLVEAIALAHDLGHTPFGHAGQDALGDCMRDHGGFEHNLQSLRVVDCLEHRYPAFDGLNLTLETRAGLLKRCPRDLVLWIESVEPGGVAHRFVAGWRPSLEAQLVNLADEVAYNAHDIDDGLRSGLLDAEPLIALPLLARHRKLALAQFPALARANPRRLLAEVVRRVLSAQVADLVATTNGMLRQFRPSSAEEAQAMPSLVRFSPRMRADIVELKRHLFAALYRHPQVTRTTARARHVLHTLFMSYAQVPAEMPAEHRAAHDALGLRAVADYVAGMTDRFAAREFERLTGEPAFGSV